MIKCFQKQLLPTSQTATFPAKRDEDGAMEADTAMVMNKRREEEIRFRVTKTETETDVVTVDKEII